MVTIIGVVIGLNAALLNIITEWLSDVKMGYCETGFYLNENFCCWGEENGTVLFLICREINTDMGQAVINGIDGPVLNLLIISSIWSLR